MLQILAEAGSSASDLTVSNAYVLTRKHGAGQRDERGRKGTVGTDRYGPGALLKLIGYPINHFRGGDWQPT